MIRQTIIALAAIGTIASSAPAALTIITGAAVGVVTITSSSAAAAECGARVTVTGAAATGAIFKLKQRRAERRAKRAWRGYIAGERSASIFVKGFSSTSGPSFGLGTRFADLDNAKNVVINCKGGSKFRCTVTATPCAR